jgi:hypothetical protein
LEIIDGEQYDIWQGQVNHNFKVKSWLSPDTGELVRALVSTKHGGRDWSNSYEVEKIERNIDISGEIFATEAPEGYILDNTKDSAQIPELQTGCTCYQDDLVVATHVAFTMPSGSVILAWHSQDMRSSASQASIFKNLKGGGPLPKLPIEIYALTSVGGGVLVTYDGRHLYHTLPRFNPPKDRVLFSLGLLNDMLIGNEQDFNKWVLGAMAELSDDGKAPADVTYEGVLELAEQIGESFVE